MSTHRLLRLWRSFGALMILAAAVVTLSGCDLVMSDLSARATDEWKKTYTVAAGARVEVLNVNGKIEVEPSTGDLVEIRAEKVGRGSSDAAAKEALARIEIVEQASETSVRVETRIARTGLFNQGAEVHYFIKVPAGLDLRVRTVNGGVSLADVSGSFTADTTNGGITGRGIAGSLEAATTNGGIDIEMDKVAEGGVRLETTNGGIDLHIPKATAATIAARLTNGRIDASSLDVQAQGEITRRRLEGTLNGGGPRIALETTNGSITIAAK